MKIKISINKNIEKETKFKTKINLKNKKSCDVHALFGYV